jgi:D-arabinono-1,4-lactone oxidase
VDEAQAISSVVYMNKGRQGFLMHSTYVDGKTHPLAPSPFHQPKSILQRTLQVLAYFEITRVIGYLYVLDVYLPKHEHAIDDIVGFTFFQGGNDAIRRAGRKLGFPMGIRQQTFVVPLVPNDPDETKQKLGDFLEAADAILTKRGLHPPLIDVLYLPDDANEGFVLSSNHGVSGYAVTITFEDPMRASFPEEEAAYEEIAEVCAKIGGRVHLVKNVFASTETMERMYQWGVEQVGALKDRYDDKRMLSSSFFRRVFPSLTR